MAGPVTYAYDNNGNLSSTTQNSQVTTRYEYDCRDQLRRVLTGGNQEAASYDYDFERHRIGKTVGNQSLKYVYGDGQVIGEYDGNNQLQNRYDVGAGEIVRAELGGEGSRHYFSDGQGSITGLAQQNTTTSSSLTASYEYDAWGNYLSAGGGSYNSIGYTGQRFDNETGLMPLGNGERYYASGLGSFIQQDSFTGMAAMAQSMNRYAYVHNNPLRFTDPSGHEGIIRDQLYDWANEKGQSWWGQWGRNMAAGIAYDAANLNSGFTMGSADVVEQHISRGDTNPPSVLSGVLKQGFASRNNPNADFRHQGSTLSGGAQYTYGVGKAAVGIVVSLAWDMNPGVMAYRGIREGIHGILDPEGYNRQQQAKIAGLKNLASKALHPIDTISRMDQDDLMEVMGESAVEAVTIADGAVGLYKGVRALRAASTIESAAELGGSTEIAQNGLGDGADLGMSAESGGTFATTDPVVIKGTRAIDLGQSYEAGVRGLYGDILFRQREYTAIVDGERVNGVTDGVTTVAGRKTAVEAKFVDSWAKSPSNPNSTIGGKSWAVAEQRRIVGQASRYSAGFEGGAIYHTNSLELAGHYSQVFKDAGITNFRFVITPATKLR